MKKIIKSVWRAICYPLLYIGAQGAAGVAAAIVIGVGIGLTMDPEHMTQQYITDAVTTQMNVTLLLLVSCVLTFFILWLILRGEWKRENVWRITGLPVIPILLCAGLGLSFSLFTDGAVYFTQLTKIFPGYEEIISGVIGKNLPLEIICVAICAPVVEEIILRGTVLRRFLDAGMKKPLALILQAFIFAVMHLNMVQGIYVFLLGIVLGLVYIWFKTVWAPISAHIAYNLISVILVHWLDFNHIEITDGVFAIITAAAFLVSAGLIYILRGKRIEYVNNYI